MRVWPLLFLLFATPFLACGDEVDEGLIRLEDFNFEIRTPPDSIDWDVLPPDEDNSEMKIHLQSVFADTDPPSQADVYVIVTKLGRDDLRRSIDKIGRRWKDVFEGSLDNKRNEKTATEQFAGVEGFTSDVQGDLMAGVHHFTFTVAKNGPYVYTFLVRRSYKAVGDEDLEKEIRQIRDSFKFLEIIKPAKHKDAKKGEEPKGPGVNAGGAEDKKIDPELLKKERFKENFWRFECIKPEGLLVQKFSENEKKQGVKYKFMHDRESCRFMVRIYAQTDKARKFTLEKLLEHKLDYWNKETKQRLPETIDKKYKFPLAEDAVRIEMIGRSKNGVKVKRIWILAECRNDRQYQLELYITGGAGEKVWKYQIEAFLKGFKPFKK